MELISSEKIDKNITGKKRKHLSWVSSITSISDFCNKLSSSDAPPSFLRSNQYNDYIRIMIELKTYNKPLIITKPTGTGKTAVFIAIINTVLKTGIPIIVIVPTISLLEQTYLRFKDYTKYLDYSIDDISIYSPSNRKTMLNKVVIICQQSFCIQTTKATKDDDTQNFFHPSTTSFIVFDEGHHAIANKTFEIISNSSKIFTMFSASTHPGQYKELDSISKHIVTYSLRDSILCGELSPVQFLTIDFSMYESARILAKTIFQSLNIKKSDELSKDALDLVSKMFLEQGGFSLTSINVLLQIINSVNTTKKSMIFTNTIEHADYIAKILSIILKEEFFAYHSNTPNREQVLDIFRTGKMKFIVAVNALDEGFDDSDVNLILDFSVYVQKTRKMIQRVGRSLRLRENGSSAIYVSVKILPENLQLLPCNYITGDLYDTHIGVNENNLINENTISMKLPCEIIVDNKTIRPRGAAITFPKQRRQFILGEIQQEFDPEIEDLINDFNDYDDDFRDMLMNFV